MTIGRDKAALPIAPMVDVVFLLLVFFLSSVEMTRSEGTLPTRLPLSPCHRGAPVHPPYLRVRLTLERAEPHTLLALSRGWPPPSPEVLAVPERAFHVRCYLDDQLLGELRQRTALDSIGRLRREQRWTHDGRAIDAEAELARALRVALDAQPDAQLIIDTDRAAPYSAFAMAVSAARQAGYRRPILFGYRFR